MVYFHGVCSVVEFCRYQNLMSDVRVARSLFGISCELVGDSAAMALTQHGHFAAINRDTMYSLVREPLSWTQHARYLNAGLVWCLRYRPWLF